MVTDSRQARSVATQDLLMRAAETLVAEQGLGNVTVRAIIALSGQKNESALQYHFGNRAGLIEAIHEQRGLAVQEQRAVLLRALLARNPQPSLRDLCVVMVAPAFRLARKDPGFRRYVQGFGRELALADSHAPEQLRTGDETTTAELHKLLRAALAHLDDDCYRQRLDSAVRCVGLAMSLQAGRASGFAGQAGDLFLHQLVDVMAGIFAAPISPETRALL